MQKHKSDIPSEYLAVPQDSIGPEYQPLPDEYLQREVHTGNGEQKETQKQKWMRLLCMLMACILLGYSVYGAEAPEEGTVATTEESQIVDGTVENRGDEEKDEEKDTGQYPLEGGSLHYKIYNETMLEQPTNDEWERILEEGEISIEQLLAGEVITLPQPETPEGFTFLGWAACFRGEKDAYPKWSMITEAFTAEEAVRIKPDEEGNRSVDIHAVWNSQDPAAWQTVMVLDANGGNIGGQASQTYNALTPKYSGGTVYLCGYPVPVREGYRFTGWYLENGEGKIRVETLPASRFFAQKDGEPDYSQPLELHLVADWEKTEEKGN